MVFSFIKGLPDIVFFVVTFCVMLREKYNITNVVMSRAEPFFCFEKQGGPAAACPGARRKALPASGPSAPKRAPALPRKRGERRRRSVFLCLPIEAQGRFMV